ncbi:CHAP domain-containing protein [Bifidobacterium jacchi]|uniref:CHAP domain-containing protein n=1 Tax=Bifidobacterium jacchi TaxID=2490545 RepID=A0A5N5RHJ7_9BIFI|nr:CHAP domain-containing protein [Bifidobacterium jacchi]KAB5606746.1 CHAP domain-containing protein [Bifidobacterium jacchi]
MRHGAHKAAKAPSQRIRTARTVFESGFGSHTARQTALKVALADGGAAILGIDQALADKLNEVAPQTRRAMREAARAAERRSHIITSASLAALVGTAATAMAFSNPHAPSLDVAQDPATTTSTLRRITDAAASRSESRESLADRAVSDQTNAAGNAVASESVSSETSEGEWTLGADSALDVDQMSRSLANNPNVAQLLDTDYDHTPDGFNPNHATGQDGNSYPYGQCTWWAYERRVQLGLPVGSFFGNGNMWADSARSMGYWVDHTARHPGDVVAFQSGQFGADATYGHVAVVERINSDGSIEVSESNVKGLGVVSHRTFSAADAAQLNYIHY